MFRVDRHPSKRDLRWFGLSLGGLLLLLAAMGWFRWHSRGAAIGFGAAAAVLLAIYYVVPAIQRPLFRAWTVATFPIAWCMAHVLFAVIYFAVITPVGRIGRLAGRDPLRLRKTSAESYWTLRDTADIPPSRYFRQS